MKRITTLIVVLLALASFAMAQETINPSRLVVKDARSIAMGGAYTALASGYQSLYGNPAGFGLGRGMLTLANVSFWGFIKPTSSNISELSGLSGGETSAILKTANNLITTNGLGAGAAMGLGWTGGGLGIGLTAVTEEYARGATLLGTQLSTVSQANVVVGLSIKLGFKDIALRLGGDLRPFMRLEGNVPASAMITALVNGTDLISALDEQELRYGVGLAADLGAIATLGSMSLGLTIRDIAPPFSFTANKISDISSTGSVTTDPEGDKGVFVPEITMAFGWSPRLIPFLLEPSLYFQMQDIVGVIKDKSSFWNLIQVGAEVKSLGLLFVRAGLNQGWASVGAGVNLLILQIDLALFTEELGLHPGDKGRSGLAANVRLHL